MENNFGNKPYDVCLTCPHLGISCDGPNFLAMEFSRWQEWVKARAKMRGMTHQNIADIANLAKGTVDTALATKSTDIRRDTMAAITHAVTGECWGQYPCHDPVQANRELSDVVKDLGSEQRKVEFLLAQIAELNETIKTLRKLL